MRKKISWGNKSIYLHRSGPLLGNGLDRPESCYGSYRFASSSKIFHIYRRAGWSQSVTLKIFFSCSVGGVGRYFSVPWWGGNYLFAFPLWKRKGEKIPRFSFLIVSVRRVRHEDSVLLTIGAKLITLLNFIVWIYFHDRVILFTVQN